MSNLTTLEVQSAGQRPQVFEFEHSPVRIGFRAGVHVELEPTFSQGPVFELVVDSEGSARFEPTVGADAYELNGALCDGSSVVEVGDIIRLGPHRITVRHLYGPPVPDPGELADDDSPTPVPAPANGSVSRQNASPAKLDAAKRPSAEPQRDEASPARLPVDEPRPRSAAEDVPVKPPNPVAAKALNESFLYLFFEPIRAFLEDDNVSEVLINGPRSIFVERRGKLEAANVRFVSEHALQAAVMNVARSIGRLFDREHPRLDARLPDGSRVHAVLAPLSRAGTVVAIRKFSREKLSIAKLIDLGSLTEPAARLLRVIVELGQNLIVSGATSSGKTAVLNALSAMIPADQRILVLEDATELQLQQPHTVAFETRKPDEHGKGEISMRDLLHSSLRLRPDRLVIGEIRGGEALDLLQAMNTGHDGTMSTIHANSPVDALVRLESCAMLAGSGFPLSALRAQIASAVHFVIQTTRHHDGSRRVTHVSEVRPLVAGEYSCKDILRFEEDLGVSSERVQGQHILTGYVPSFAAAAKRRGLPVAELFPGLMATP
jgi:Flp pilus assembly CpaF family ATPase